MNRNPTLEKFDFIRKSEFVGELTRSFSFTDEPKFFMYNCSKRGDKEGSSSCDLTKEGAKIKALGEHVERYCLDNPSIFFSREDVSTGLMEPGRFVNFRNEDMGNKKKEYLEKLSQLTFNSVEGLEAVTGSKVKIPAQLVYINYPFQEPLIRPRISTGAATHETFEAAAILGIMENIERDAYMLAYYAKRDVPKIKLEGDLRELEKYFSRYKLGLSVFETTTDVEVPSFMCVNTDRTGIGPAVSIGLSAGLNSEDAIKNSILESQQVRQWIRYENIERGVPEINFPEEIRSVIDRGFYWYPVKRISDMNFLLKEPKVKKQSDIISPKVKNLEELTGLLQDKGVSTYLVDIGYSELKQAGFEVVKAIQPELHPLFLEESLPCLDSPRMLKYLGNKKINSTPHPFM
jgi:thiazole/oxazole-forming peptide maturase SagD family component